MPRKTKVSKTKKTNAAHKPLDISVQAQFVLLAIMGLSLTGMLFAYAVLTVNL